MEYKKEKVEMLYDIYNVIADDETKQNFLDFIYEIEEFWKEDIEKENDLIYYNDVY